MKKLIAMSLGILCAVQMSGQRNRVRDVEYFPRNEIYIQYGTPTVIELSTIKLTKNISNETYEGYNDDYAFFGVAGLGYNFSITPRFSLGIYGGVNYGRATSYLTEYDGHVFNEPVKVCRDNLINYTGHLCGTLTYWQDGPFEISGALYLGVTYVDEQLVKYNTKYYDPVENDRAKFSFHLTAAKFRYGEIWGFFAELGFGYRGLVNAGLSVKL